MLDAVTGRLSAGWTRFRARLHPIEGWSIVLLHALLIVTAASVVSRSGWVEVPQPLPILAALGALVGLILAKTRCPDIVAHLTACLLGVWVVALAVASRFPELGLTRRDRLAALIQRGEEWYRQTTAGEQRDDPYLFVLVLGFTLWLVAYLSAWTLFRRRWLMVSLLLPGFLILVMMGYSPELGSWPLGAYLLVAGVLTARYFAFRRQQVWSRFQIPAPHDLPWRFFGIGSNLVVVVLLLAWTLPLTTQTAAFDGLQERLDAPADALRDGWNDLIPELSGLGSATRSSYASFGDSFELGGALELGDEPAVTMRNDGIPQYLVGLRYDTYTGHGWESDVEATFDPVGPDGTTYSPQLTFQSQQEVALSDGIRGGRAQVGGQVTVVRPKGDLLFTLDTYLRSDQPTSVQLSWRQLDQEPFDLGTDDRARLPPDLNGLAALLLTAEAFDTSGGTTGESPMPAESGLALKVRTEQDQLAKRFLDTRWTIDDDGVVTLFVTGQLPVYDDVEAVYARVPPEPSETYGVVGLESEASPAALRRADDAYPAYVTQRYLQLPTTVTERTRELAATLAGDSGNAFDIASAVEREVRSRIEYSLDIDAPPSDQDVVDYVLFDSQIGYCEYHSSAMAVLLRTLGIPARVAVGYHQVDFDVSAQSFVYRESDAHAWVEVFFLGYGWIPFEPTPSEPQRDYGSAALADTPTPSQTPVVEPADTPDPTATVEEAATPTPVVPPLSTSNDAGPGERGWLDWLPWATVGVTLGIAGTIWLLWSLSLRGLSPAGALLRQAARVGGWLGVRADPTMTPGEFASELGRVVPATRQPARYVADLYAAERYGGQLPSPAQRYTGRIALRQIRRSLMRAVLWRRATRGHDDA